MDTSSSRRTAGVLVGKVAVITGATGGIGRVTAQRFVEEGASVVVADRNVAGAEFAASLGPSATFVRADVTVADDVAAMVAHAVDTFGGLHVLCNVAGVSGSLRRFLDDDLRDFERVVSVNLWGVLLTTRLAALHMAAHGGGSIVNVASGAGITPGVGMQPYRAAKAGVVHATRSLAVELGEHGIRINAVAPANIATDINAAFDKASVTRLQPLPHQGMAIDVAEAVVYFASDRAAHVTGTVLPIDGGMAVGTPPRMSRPATPTTTHP